MSESRVRQREDTVALRQVKSGELDAATVTTDRVNSSVSKPV